MPDNTECMPTHDGVGGGVVGNTTPRRGTPRRRQITGRSYPNATGIHDTMIESSLRLDRSGGSCDSGVVPTGLAEHTSRNEHLVTDSLDS